MKKLRAYFGSKAILYLNSESALTALLRNLPDREPGMYVGIDERHEKRFSKIIDKVGLKALVYSGQKSLAEVLENDHLLAIIIPDNYEVVSRRYKEKYRSSGAVKIVFQNRKKPRSVSIEHDMYIWEPRFIPRTISGSVLVTASETYTELHTLLKRQNFAQPRLENSAIKKDLRFARRGLENKFRRIDRRPAPILPRMLYDFYK